MAAEEIKDGVFWVGAIDWDVRDFHGYSTYQGTTYNAYLVKDEKVALFDTVKGPFEKEMLYNIREVMNPEDIDYIIVNHVELDHTGYLPGMIELCKPEKVFCSPMGLKAIQAHFHMSDEWPLEVVKSGDTLSLGAKTVQFLETKMLHWPDSMFSYIPEEKLLISSDAFGQHLATTERYADELAEDVVFGQAKKYFANILHLFAPNVTKLLKTVGELGIEIDMIAPDHGLIWRDQVPDILDDYRRWASYEMEPKAVIIYDSMWHSTERMAKAISNGLLAEGVQARILSAKLTHRSEIMTEIMGAKGLILGSPTLNNGILPTMADVCTYLTGLRPKHKIGAAFGSFGWSGESVKHLNVYLEQMGVDIAHEGMKVKNVPTEEDYKALTEMGAQIGRAIQKSFDE
ncbi:MAG: flavodoxin domain-containing protein [Spirochaetales bacterium]|jgi:flavorubredoxin|nr:flavodoxin domain-containing protein [Spirochaetales bacterium]